MKVLFKTPAEMFENIDKMQTLLVAMKIKVIGAPYSSKYINPRYIIKGNDMILTAENLNEPLTIPLYLVEEIVIRWEMFGHRNGNRLTVDCKYFQEMLSSNIIKDIQSFIDNTEKSSLPFC